MILDTVFLIMTGVCILTLLILAKKDKGVSGKTEGYTYETNENPNSYAVLGKFGIAEDRTIVENGKKDKAKDEAEENAEDAEDEAEAEAEREKRDRMKYAYMKAQQQEQRDRRLERTVRTLG
jgi:hypothetical protein